MTIGSAALLSLWRAAPPLGEFWGPRGRAVGGASVESDPRLDDGGSSSMSRFRVSKFRHAEAKVARKEVGGRAWSSVVLTAGSSPR